MVDGLQVKLNATYLPEAKYTSFPDAIVYELPLGPFGFVTNYNYDASGTRMLAAPKLTGTASLDYTADLSAGRLNINASLYHSSTYRCVYTGAVETRAYDLLGARASFTPAGSNFQFAVFGKNLTNKAYYTGMTPNPDASVGFFGHPREIGVSASYTF